MASPTFSDLTTVPTEQQILDGDVLPELRSRGARVTDWLTGGLYRTMSYAVARLWQQGRTLIAGLTASGLGDYVFGLATAPNGIDVTSWCGIYAKQVYGVDRIEATFTKRTITLTNSTATVYGPVADGRMILQFSSGNRYVNDGAFSIAASGATSQTFRSEFRNGNGYEYNDPKNDTIAIITAIYPGVTATNPPPVYSPVAQQGAGLGTLTLTGSATGNHTVIVRIDSTGESGVATWSTSLGGGAYVSHGAAASITNLGGFAINIALTNGAAAPSFVLGSTYTFTTNDTDVTQSGRDQETPQELGARCKALFPSLSFAQNGAGNWIPASPTLSAYEALAKSANSQVKICYAQTSTTINNVVNVYVAGQGAALGAVVIANVQAFFDHFTMLTDVVTVQSTGVEDVTVTTATVTVTAAQAATAQIEAQRRLVAYMAGVDVNAPLGVGGSSTGVIDHSYVCSLIRTTPGVVGLTDTTLQIHGAAANYTIPTGSIANYTSTLASSLTWVVV